VERSKDADFLMKHGITPGKYVLAVGRITPEKGFDVLVEAVNKSPEVEQLVIAGASDHSNEYYERLKVLDINDKVIFTGFTTGEYLRQLYSHARMFVLSSYNEGFPLVLLEAMGYGLPLVVSDIPATHLLTFPDEDYVPVGDAEAMSKAIVDKWNKVDGSSVKYDLTEFNWSNIAAQTEAILMGK
jgi:glycosyltransferase involved in cell wall biosynthesis